MVHAVILISVLCLSGCSIIFPPKYDTNEYLLITNIRTDAELSIRDCESYRLSKFNFSKLHGMSSLFINFSEHLPRNYRTFQMAAKLMLILDRSNELYQENPIVSSDFCKAMLSEVSEAANEIQQAVGNKPR